MPIFYGWVIVAIAFVTMAISVSARTSFSLLLPPLLNEFGWDRGLAAGAFSFGFLVSAVLGPFIGRVMDRRGPRLVIECGVALTGIGMLLAAWIREPWHLYVTLGVLVGAGSNFMSYSAQSSYLPNWFVRHRSLAISIAFSGVGIGAIVLMPWLQSIILVDGWRAACTTMGLLIILILGPINVFVRRAPSANVLQSLTDSSDVDGADRQAATRQNADQPSAIRSPLNPVNTSQQPSNVVDAHWAATEWTLGRAIRTSRFWWLVLGYFSAMFAWYTVQVHQTQFLTEIGFSPSAAAWALGWVSVCAIPGQIGLGALSDRIGREWIWSAGCAGFALCYVALIALEHHPGPALLWTMVLSQGFLGYALTSVMGPIVAEIFEGPHYATIFGTLVTGMIGGAALGPYAAGLAHDVTGSYRWAFIAAIVLCAVSAASIWLAAPRKVRCVPGQAQ